MATVTKENIGPLHEKLIVKIEKTDYLPSFEKALKEYGKKANIPGFRKGMVPSGLIKKMYGASVFTDEILKTVDKELIGYLQNDKLDIFAQPLPIESSYKHLDVNNPTDYSFEFEIGMKPGFDLPELAKAKITRYVVDVTDEMINNEITRLQNRFGNMKDLDNVESEENVLNVIFTEVDENANPVENGITKDNSLLVKYFREDFRKELIGKTINDFVIIQLDKAFDKKELEFISKDLGLNETDPASEQKHFKIQLTKIGLLEKAGLNEDFYKQVYPGTEIKSEAEFRDKLKEEIQLHWKRQADNQIHDQLFHHLVDHSAINVPEGFLKKWMKTQGEQEKNSQPKSEEEIEKEFPTFLNQLKWTLITDKIVSDHGIQVNPDEIRFFAKQQLFSYMGNASLADDQPWVNDYIEKMMKDRKYVEDAYNRIQTSKIFEWGSTQVKPTDKSISAEAFSKMVEEHQHHHH